MNAKIFVLLGRYLFDLGSATLPLIEREDNSINKTVNSAMEMVKDTINGKDTGVASLVPQSTIQDLRHAFKHMNEAFQKEALFKLQKNLKKSLKESHNAFRKDFRAA